MKKGKTISDLITSSSMLQAGRINIIEANVSSGKTYFALDTIPRWAGNPERVLYLIDTNNGEYSIQKNIITVSRQTYELCDFAEKHDWSDDFKDADNKMPVMTYQGFGSLMRHSPKFAAKHFDFIVCDEMQNLVRYGEYGKPKANPEAKKEKKYLEQYAEFVNRTENIRAAQMALLTKVCDERTRVIALSATPERIRDFYGELCYDVPIDRAELRQLETFDPIPYREKVETILQHGIGKKGILYVETVGEMKDYIEAANAIGIRTNGFWSLHNEKRPMSQDQLDLRQYVLANEALPPDLDLLVINAASETCIKIQSEKTHLDYMIVHNCNKETQIQARGRYHGDLQEFFYHDIDASNLYSCRSIPDCFLNVRLYAEEQKALCDYLDLKSKKNPFGLPYSFPTVAKCLKANGFNVSESKKDTKNGGKHYRIITKK